MALRRLGQQGIVFAIFAVMFAVFAVTLHGFATPENMLTLLQTWQQGDVSTIRHSGDLGKCLSEVKPKGLIMPSKTDLYFTVGRVRLIWCMIEYLIALVARRQRDRSVIHEEHSQAGRY